MAVLHIVTHPDPRLRAVCAPVGAVDDAVRALAADMLETMYAAPGRGLAAPQVGVLRRLFVMDPGWRDGAPEPLVCIDPELTDPSAETATRTEGCLSIPDLPLPVARPAEITLRWTGLDGRRQERRLTGFAATVAQHEADHLDGVLILDRVEGAGG
jgi:peptide deformylase